MADLKLLAKPALMRLALLGGVILCLGVFLAYKQFMPITKSSGKSPAVAKRNDSKTEVPKEKPRTEPKLEGEEKQVGPTEEELAAEQANAPVNSSETTNKSPDPMAGVPLVDAIKSGVARLLENDPREKGGFLGQIFVRLDQDGDLRLQPQEIPSYYREQMLACDADSNGLIDFNEFEASIDRLPLPPMKTTIAASALINPPEPGKEIPVYQPQSKERKVDAPVWFTQYDRSKDGHIAIYEWPAGRLTEFRALDANNDGFITLEEAKRAEAIKEAERQRLEAESKTVDRGPTDGREPR